MELSGKNPQFSRKLRKTIQNSERVTRPRENVRIVLEKPISDMHKDTKLVVADIPGFNEAGSSSKYTDSVSYMLQ